MWTSSLYTVIAVWLNASQRSLVGGGRNRSAGVKCNHMCDLETRAVCHVYKFHTKNRLIYV